MTTPAQSVESVGWIVLVAFAAAIAPFYGVIPLACVAGILLVWTIVMCFCRKPINGRVFLLWMPVVYTSAICIPTLLEEKQHAVDELFISKAAAVSFFSAKQGEYPSLEELRSQFGDTMRFMVLGKKLPDVYHEPSEKSFIVSDRMDRKAAVRCVSEHVLVLLPPDNAKYYPHSSEFAYIHRNGHPALVFVAELPGGWQVWEAVKMQGR